MTVYLGRVKAMTATTTSTKKQELKLEKITLPKFDGIQDNFIAFISEWEYLMNQTETMSFQEKFIRFREDDATFENSLRQPRGNQKSFLFQAEQPPKMFSKISILLNRIHQLQPR